MARNSNTNPLWNPCNSTPVPEAKNNPVVSSASSAQEQEDMKRKTEVTSAGGFLTDAMSSLTSSTAALLRRKKKSPSPCVSTDADQTNADSASAADTNAVPSNACISDELLPDDFKFSVKLFNNYLPDVALKEVWAMWSMQAKLAQSPLIYTRVKNTIESNLY